MGNLCSGFDMVLKIVELSKQYACASQLYINERKGPCDSGGLGDGNGCITGDRSGVGRLTDKIKESSALTMKR